MVVPCVALYRLPEELAVGDAHAAEHEDTGAPLVKQFEGPVVDGDGVDLKEVLERFEEFDGVAGKGKGGLTEFRCELLNLYCEVRQTIIYPKGHPLPPGKETIETFSYLEIIFCKKVACFSKQV